MKLLLSLLIPIFLYSNQKFIEPQMVLIKPGSFLFGSNSGENDEKSLQTIDIIKSFYIAKYEVTFEEYDLYCKDVGLLKPKDNGWGRGKKPVIYVSFEDAKSYALWLSKKTGKKYRLPTEIEWEYAAKSDTNFDYHFGDDVRLLKKFAWYDENSFLLGKKSRYFGPQEVGSKLPNQNGLYDMHGNVWEWVDSEYTLNHDSSYIIDPNYKVLKGGCWASKAWYLRSAKREFEYRNYTSASDGFRLARDVD